MSVLHENSEYYENKYLKYKAKYLELKQIIGGRSSAATVRRAKDEIREKIREINKMLNKMLNNLGDPKNVIDDSLQPPTNYLKPLKTFRKELSDTLNAIGECLQNNKFTLDQQNKLNNILNDNKKLNLSELISLKNFICPNKQPVSPAVTQPVSPSGSTSSGKSSGSFFNGFGPAFNNIIGALTRRL